MSAQALSKLVQPLVMILALCLITSCKKKTTEEASVTDEDASYYVIETSVTDAGQLAKSVESGETSMALRSSSPLVPMTACDYATARSACDTNALTTTVDWNNCTLSVSTSSGTTSMTLDGTITETYSGFGAASCLMTGNNSTVNRVISSSDPWILTFASGATLTRDMNPGTAWDGTTFPNASQGTAITRIESGTSNGLTCSVSARCYHIVANGLHKTFRGPAGRVWFEHIVDSDVTFTGKKSSSNRTMAGTVTTWHELAQYKAVNTFTNVIWGSSTCCYPTSGSISTTLTGSLTGTMGMTFSSTCGETTVTGTDSTQQTVQLTQCSE